MKSGHIKSNRNNVQDNEEKDGKGGRRPKGKTPAEKKHERKMKDASKKANR